MVGKWLFSLQFKKDVFSYCTKRFSMKGISFCDKKNNIVQHKWCQKQAFPWQKENSHHSNTFVFKGRNFKSKEMFPPGLNFCWIWYLMPSLFCMIFIASSLPVFGSQKLKYFLTPWSPHTLRNMKGAISKRGH